MDMVCGKYSALSRAPTMLVLAASLQLTKTLRDYTLTICHADDDIVRPLQRCRECDRNIRTKYGHRMSIFVTMCLKSNGGAYYGQLVANGNRDDSALAKAGLTASRT